jgi:hypothetical protein
MYAVSKVASRCIHYGVFVCTVPPLRCGTDPQTATFHTLLARRTLPGLAKSLPSPCAISAVAKNRVSSGSSRPNSNYRSSGISETRSEGSALRGRRPATSTWAPAVRTPLAPILLKASSSGRWIASRPATIRFARQAKTNAASFSGCASVLLATDHWPLTTAPWTSTNSKLSSK